MIWLETPRHQNSSFNNLLIVTKLYICRGKPSKHISRDSHVIFTRVSVSFGDILIVWIVALIIRYTANYRTPSVYLENKLFLICLFMKWATNIIHMKTSLIKNALICGRWYSSKAVVQLYLPRCEMSYTIAQNQWPKICKLVPADITQLVLPWCHQIKANPRSRSGHPCRSGPSWRYVQTLIQLKFPGSHQPSLTYLRSHFKTNPVCLTLGNVLNKICHVAKLAPRHKNAS